MGVLGESEFLRQDLDHMFDLRCVVLSHKLSHQPEERRGKHPASFSFCQIQTLGCWLPVAVRNRGSQPQQPPEKVILKWGRLKEPTSETRALLSSLLTPSSHSLPPCCSQPAASCTLHQLPAQDRLCRATPPGLRACREVTRFLNTFSNRAGYESFTFDMA